MQERLLRLASSKRGVRLSANLAGLGEINEKVGADARARTRTLPQAGRLLVQVICLTSRHQIGIRLIGLLYHSSQESRHIHIAIMSGKDHSVKSEEAKPINASEFPLLLKVSFTNSRSAL